MSTLHKLTVAVIATATIIAGANSANAFTVTTGSAPSTFEGFESGLPANYTGGAIVTGSVANQYAQPVGSTGNYLTVAPSGSGVPGATGNVTINLNQLYNSFSFLWGSIDPSNKIEFFNAGNLIQSYTGSDIQALGLATANSSTSDSDANKFFNFFAGAGEEFNQVVLTTGQIAFETDNHSFATVPEPASILGLLAFGALGAGSVVKRKSKTA